MRRPNLDAIRRRVAAATPGTWKTGDRFGAGALGSHVAVISGNLPPIELDIYRNGRADAAFIAHARQDIPALLTEIDRRPDVSAREAAALDRLLDAYVGNDDGDPGMADLRTLQDKIHQLDQDHAAYERDSYFCPTSGEIESPHHGGFKVCCAYPELHEPVPAA